METQTIDGEVQNVKDKAVAINGIWYGSFNKITGFKKGDNASIVYTVNTKDGKTFYNIKSIKLVELPSVSVIRNHESKNTIPDTTVNTILMKVFDSYTTLRINGIVESIESLTKEAIKSHKLISSL